MQCSDSSRMRLESRSGKGPQQPDGLLLHTTHFTSRSPTNTSIIPVESNPTGILRFFRLYLRLPMLGDPSLFHTQALKHPLRPETRISAN